MFIYRVNSTGLDPPEIELINLQNEKLEKNNGFL